jgi:hypothetical protein
MLKEKLIKNAKEEQDKDGAAVCRGRHADAPFSPCI